MLTSTMPPGMSYGCLDTGVLVTQLTIDVDRQAYVGAYMQGRDSPRADGYPQPSAAWVDTDQWSSDISTTTLTAGAAGSGDRDPVASTSSWCRGTITGVTQSGSQPARSAAAPEHFTRAYEGIGGSGRATSSAKFRWRIFATSRHSTARCADPESCNGRRTVGRNDDILAESHEPEAPVQAGRAPLLRCARPFEEHGTP